MILSAELLLSDDQDLAQSAGSYASTNYIDLGAAGTPYGAAAALSNDPGPGTPVPLEVLITETFTSGGAATLSVALQMDDNTSFSSATTIKTSATFALADLTVGTNIFPDLFLPTGLTERYFRLNYTIGTAATTAGKITAGISGGRQTNQ